MGDTLDGITHRMCKVIHGVDTPLVPSDGVRRPLYPVQGRVPQVHVGTQVVDLRSQDALSIRKTPFFHIGIKVQVLLDSPRSKRRILTRLCECASELLHLLLERERQRKRDRE